MSVAPDQPTAEQTRAFGEKLIAFRGTLDPREDALFVDMMVSAREALQAEVMGFDSESTPSDLVTKINWDALTALSIAPPPNVAEGNRLDKGDFR